ncbi:helix-turn-helix transcriptional regulator, partial [Streptomyces sp. NPDC059477]|uniref:helix-turn-helix transcriptional regulator n=1 Tax=Streptomyces sp. NPDC059477 TaxID=3346847 RepID=UPI00368CFE66
MALPQRPPTFLRRERLSRRLDEGLRTPLTVVNGGAGAGKTLLVADWAAGLAVPVAWLTAEAGDRRPGVFWAYLLEALRGCGAGVSAAVRVPGDAVRVERRTLALLADELSAREEPVVVVVDEFERVGGGEVAEQVEYVLRHVGGGLRLVLVSRAEPLLPLHRYRVAGELTEVRGAELAFTPEEAVTLLESHGLSVPVASARALVERTRGWAAGLRLCAMAALESDDPEVYLKEFEAGRSTVADFLLAEVLARQPVDAQDLLLRVSVLTRFGPDLANALTGRSDAEPLLVGLHEANAFVERLGHGWFRLHPLFREILLAHLRVRLPGLEPALRLRAARWLLRSGDLAEALAHGSAAGEWDFTADALVGDLAIGQLFAGLRAGHFGPLFARMAADSDADADSVPADLVRAALEMETGVERGVETGVGKGVGKGVETGVGMSIHRGVRYLRAAEERLGAAVSESSGAAPLGSLGSPGSPRSPGAGPAALASCALLRALAARLTGDPAGAALAAERFQEVYGDVSPSLFDRHPEFLALLHAHLGSAYLWGGRFQDAREVLMGVGGAVPPVHADALGQLALIDYLYGWGARGERRVVGDGGRESASLLGGCGLGGLVLAAVAVERDELDRAQALLDETAGGKGNGGGGFPAVDPLVVAVRGLVRARLLLARGHPWGGGGGGAPPDYAGIPPPRGGDLRGRIGGGAP